MKTGMVVDDAAVMRIRLRDILETRYKVVAEAANGREALDLYESYRPDFVTLDITMPQLNGMETLVLMIRAFPDAKVVIVSAVGQRQMVFQAIARGAKDFIIKPFEAQRVLMAIDRLFE
ncbi:MAG: response regulator [Spirochaetaceae bacterium]|nr:response regulator [Spirochaetaceae bacterium]